MNTTDSNIQAHSPAYARSPVEGETSVRELPWRGKINLRGHVDGEFSSAVSHALNIALPTRVNSKQAAGDTCIYCTGPNEWLIYCDIDKVAQTMDKLKQALNAKHHSMVEVSDYYTVLELKGPEAEHVLRAGSPLDIHPSVFPVDSVAQTRYGHASILLDKVADHTYHIQIRWSFTEYLWDYFSEVLSLRD